MEGLIDFILLNRLSDRVEDECVCCLPRSGGGRGKAGFHLGRNTDDRRRSRGPWIKLNFVPRKCYESNASRKFALPPATQTSTLQA